MTTALPEFAVVGRIRRAHGLRGEVLVEPSTDAPDAVFAPGRRVFVGSPAGDPVTERGELSVAASRPFKGGWLVQFAGIADRTAAETWRERTLLLPVEELEPPAEGEIFLHDLPGMRVEEQDGETLGEIAHVWELPHGLLIEVKRADGSTTLIPWREEIVERVDDEQRVVVVALPPGLLD